MRFIKKGLKKIDVFGYPISLNYKRQGDTFQTIYGGGCTIITISLLFAYFVMLLTRMIYHQQDMITSNEESLDLNTLGKVHLNNTRLKFFSYMFKDYVRANLSIEDLRKNLDIYYEQVD